MRRNRTYDPDVVLKDAYAVAASAAAEVSNVAKILDVGAGLLEGQIVVDITSIEVDGSAAQGTLTLDTNPTGGNSSQGLLTIAVNPIEDDTMTIDSVVYRFRDTLAQAEDIQIGADVAATILNVIATINGTGEAGTEFFTGTTSPHTSVWAGDFAADDSIITAIATGTAGDSIDTTETFDSDSNIFDAATLGTTDAGADGDIMTIDSKVYYFDVNSELRDVDGHIEVGATAADTQASIVEALALGGTLGSGYAANMTLHPTVSIAAFATDDAILTAKTKGTAGDLIVTTEDFTAGTNVFDASTLGATRAGTAGDERYDLVLQGSNSETFANTYTDLAAVAVGAAAVINGDIVTIVGRILMPFVNEFLGTKYRYLRMYTVIDGEHVAAGINYTARLGTE